ncbi:CLUMA_CG005215, isoform A [Clunio marinus]|uniref:CLUMA_CG005215, isoform A n=1 Tax=Clunio marinus TaxID=568069 RepID=A0A1J1HU09_9DIPT|nr:CLUMA_CG005215, isoform A [Clunio marinus]
MGLIGWIKKEIESTSRQRRQSAPPPTSVGLSGANNYRDEAYMRAISKFNEWRNNQRFERLSESRNVSGITQPPTNDQTIMTDDFSLLSDVFIDDSEKRKLIEMQRERKKKEFDRKLEHNVCFYNTARPKNHRLSLPNMNEDTLNRSQVKRRSKRSKVHPSQTIDEIEEFEQNHCHKIDEDYSIQVTSPPSKFYRDNIDPYGDNKQSSSTNKSIPKRHSLMGRNMLRRAKSHGKEKAPQPPQKHAESEASSNFQNGNFKHYEVNTSSVYSEFVKASNAYKVNMRKHEPEKVNSVGESASSGSLSSDVEKNVSLKNQRRLSPPYQTVINKHGDEVEYALPYSERESLVNIPPLPTTAPPDASRISQSKFEQIINENFQFLNSNIEFFNAEESMLNRQMADAAFEPIDTSFSDIRRKNLQVTDLDKSNDTGLVTPLQSGDIIRELDTLSKWTKNLENCEKKFEQKSPIEEYQMIQSNVKIFNPHDIKYKSGILRNSFSTPLEFSNGYFHSTPVTLRSTLPNLYSINSFADIACKREFEILSQMKHQSIAVLIGICHDSSLRVMSLILEPFDYTLNHYLHQMDQYFAIQEVVSIVQQVASATQYLHENGFIHSNISSHAVLIREWPFAVRLSSFELTTEIQPRESLGLRLFKPDNVINNDKDLMLKVPTEAVIAEKYYKLSKQHFYNRTSLPIFKYGDADYELDSHHPHSVVYRRMFSMHYYQPPELLIPSTDNKLKYVLPTKKSDIFSLALLLWESLNHCVPFVIFNHDELIHAYKQNEAKLPFLDKTATLFMDIFDTCLRADADERVSHVTEFISMLEEVREAGETRKVKESSFSASFDPLFTRKEIERRKNYMNVKFHEKVPEKIYFSRKNIEEIDPQKRMENAITAENLLSMGVGHKDTSKVSESMKSSEIEAQIKSFSHQPGILRDNALERIKRSVEEQRVIAPKKPSRKKDENHEEVFDHSKRSLNADSTMYQSFFDFNRLHTPKIDKDVMYERTSTLKKRSKVPTTENQKKSVKGLFEKQQTTTAKVDAFEKMNNELSQISQEFNKNDFMNEIVQELNERQKSGRDDVGLGSFLNHGMSNTIPDQSRSFEELPADKSNEIEMPKIKRSESDIGNNYQFADDDYSSPRTPIALKNKIRRNAWLSDSKKPSGGRISDFDDFKRKQNKSLNFINSNDDQRKLNVSIKIHHNDLDVTPKQNNINIDRNSSINIQLTPKDLQKSSLMKINNIDLNNSRYPEDINKKYYPMMPEMLSDVIQNKRDRSVHFQASTNSYVDATDTASNEKEEVEENVIVPVRTSVREAVKFIESTFHSPQPRVVMGRTSLTTADRDNFFSTPQNQNLTPQGQEKFFTPLSETPKTAEKSDEAGECLMKAAESIQKLDEVPCRNLPFLVNKRLENVVNQQTPSKITTKVTVNLKQISSTRRSSDIEHLKKSQEQNRHSICNNAELIKRLQVHFKSMDKEQSLVKKENHEISASCSSLVPKDPKKELAQAGKCSKYFCRNCGFTMIPAEVLKKIQSNGRLSIASNLAGSLQSIKFDDGTSSQSMATALRKFHPINEAKSTEDLYIDDDFCQSLGANMELMPTPEFFESMDFNFLTAEIFHMQEHEFDCSLNDEEKAQLGCNCNQDEINAIKYHEDEETKTGNIAIDEQLEDDHSEEVLDGDNKIEEV